MQLLAIASLTVREAMRRRLVGAVAVLTVVVIALSLWGFAKLHAVSIAEHHPPPSELAGAYALLVIMLAQMFGFVLAVGAAFLAAPSLAGDIESGILLVILPRAIRRVDVLLGKWLGLVVLLSVYIFGAGGLELVGVRAVTHYLPPHPVEALAYLTLQTIVLMSLALALSTRLSAITGGIIALVLYGVGFVAQIAGTLAALFQNTTLLHGCTVVSLIIPTGELWRGAAFALEPVVLAALSGTPAGANPFTVSSPPTSAFLVWTAAWLVLVLAWAIASFQRRDI
jgi:ABC-type transport system involved in multi-copper enzyme maturation permease subunit